MKFNREFWECSFDLIYALSVSIGIKSKHFEYYVMSERYLYTDLYN